MSDQSIDQLAGRVPTVSGPHEPAGQVREERTLSEADIERIAQRTAELVAGANGGSCRIVDVATVARELGVSVDYVYEHQRELGAMRLGRGPKASLRFDLAAIMAHFDHPTNPRRQGGGAVVANTELARHRCCPSRAPHRIGGARVPAIVATGGSMARPATGEVKRHVRKDGLTSFALRFRAYGQRRFGSRWEPTRTDGPRSGPRQSCATRWRASTPGSGGRKSLNRSSNSRAKPWSRPCIALPAIGWRPVAGS